MTTEKRFGALLSSPQEHSGLEFKEASRDFDQAKLYSYCVALANEGGGQLILGVTDKSPRRVVGTGAFKNPQKTEGQILDKLGFRVDIETIHHPDGRVLVCTIPSRPRGTAYALEGRFLMRSGERLVAMTEDRLRSIFEEGKPDWFSSEARGECTAEEAVDLLDTTAYFDLVGTTYPASRDAVLERFAREGLISRFGEAWSISNLGAMLFAKDLRRFGKLSRRAPRVIVYDGISKTRTKRDETGSKGYAVGFQGLVKFVESQTPTNEVIEQALRHEVRMFPPVALRELLANALIHQDFTVTGASVMVEIYDDRIEISNPGRPPVETDRFIDEYQSRNERLADLMRRFRICEEKGSGIDKVVEAAEAYQLPAPEFRVDSVRTTSTLFGHRAFEKMDRGDRVRACYQHCALRYVLRQKATNQSLRERFGLLGDRAETASRILRDTVDAGLIKLEDPDSGSKKYSRYLPYWA